MKKLFPRPREICVMLVMAVVCTVVVGLMQERDLALAVLGAPVFFVSALMGFRRSGEE